MNIAVISPGFPTQTSISFIFVEQLCREFVFKGHQVTVISPQSLTKAVVRKRKVLKASYELKLANGKSIKVYRPYCLSLGNGRFSVKQFNKAVDRVLNRTRGTNYDVIYGHFWESAFAGSKFAKANNIPLFAVAGEDYIIFDRYITHKEKEELVNNVAGCICVSSKSKEETLSHQLIDESKCEIIPNAINPNLFFKKDKNQLRNQYGFPKSDFIVAFVGQFTSRKGTMRVCEALRQINKENIKALFIGSGPEKPNYPNTLVEGTIMHDKLPDYLNMADVFVLPTLSEGCCNAIIEAMACGLPIISTDASFNRDILDQDNSILIDPNSIEQIKNSILMIYQDGVYREKLSQGALNTASKLTLEKRAQRILDFINKRIAAS